MRNKILKGGLSAVLFIGYFRPPQKNQLHEKYLLCIFSYTFSYAQRAIDYVNPFIGTAAHGIPIRELQFLLVWCS